MVQSQRHLGDATVNVAKPLRRQAKRACVVHHETTQAKTQKPKKSHLRNSGGSRRKREAVKAEKHPSVDEPGPDVSNYLSTRAVTGSIGAVPAARLPSRILHCSRPFFPTETTMYPCPRRQPNIPLIARSYMLRRHHPLRRRQRRNRTEIGTCLCQNLMT